MRKIAFIAAENEDGIKKVMLYECKDGVYLFGYDSVNDVPAKFDYMYTSIAEAEEACFEAYGITSKGWVLVDDPEEHCQHDLIRPIRIKGRELGKPIWGCYEILANGKWIEFTFEQSK